MLVLSRKRGESIMIGDIQIMVVDYNSDRVRLGIDAPEHIHVRRTELAEIERDTDGPQKTQG